MISVKVSAVPLLLLAGIYVSSMSSCLGAMYGTPRVLQSIANESVIPGIDVLGKGVSRPACSYKKSLTSLFHFQITARSQQSAALRYGCCCCGYGLIHYSGRY